MTANELDKTLQALADPSRRGVVELLKKKSRRAGELAKALELTAPAMSRHLRVLKEAGLVEEAGLPVDGDARSRVYQLRKKPFAALRQWSADVEHS